MQQNINDLKERIEILEADLSNTESKLKLSTEYATSLEQKLIVNEKENNNLIPLFLVFIILIVVLFILIKFKR